MYDGKGRSDVDAYAISRKLERSDWVAAALRRPLNGSLGFGSQVAFKLLSTRFNATR